MQPFLAMVYPIDGGHADNTLPGGSGGRPDQGLPRPPRPTDPGYGQGGWNRPSQGLPGYGHPDQGLPGYGHPDQGLPGYGHPDQGLPGSGGHPSQGLPGGGGGSTLPVWSPIYGWLIMHIASRPDQSLPGQPGHISGQPVPPPQGGSPDNTLPQQPRPPHASGQPVPGQPPQAGNLPGQTPQPKEYPDKIG